MPPRRSTAARSAAARTLLDERAQSALADAQRRISECQQFLAERLVELEGSDRQSTSLAHRLYDQALACRMRPFADGVVGFPRMVRDVGRSLGKQVRLEIVGAATQVDRDILEKLDAPLGHLLRNAVDHGIETPDERRAAGKPAEGRRASRGPAQRRRAADHRLRRRPRHRPRASCARRWSSAASPTPRPPAS